MYGPISMQGEINRSAGLGVKNSPFPPRWPATGMCSKCWALFEEYMSPERVLQGTQLQVKAGLGLGTVLKGVTKGNLARPIAAGRAMMKTVANVPKGQALLGANTVP